jgi:hypothetical protein
MFYRGFLFFMLLTLSGGCETFSVSKPPATSSVSTKISVSAAERDFATALHYLRNGNEAVSRDLFRRVVDEPSVSGVTDEAIFRMALLYLRDENGKGEKRAAELFDRLFSEFPGSIWSRQAAPLALYVKETSVLRSHTRELKVLRNQNLSLSRDNKELRQSIERIKNLDLELEQKIRR